MSITRPRRSDSLAEIGAARDPSGIQQQALEDSSKFCRNDSSSVSLWPTHGLIETRLSSFAEIGTAEMLFPARQHTLFLPSWLPSAESAVFNNSYFFRRNGSGFELPSPTGVPAKACRMGVMDDCRPPPVHYLSLGLTVKYGRTVSTEEGQCLWAVRQLLGDAVPVPEVYGWTVEAGVSYIYMEYIPGELSDQWDSLSESEKRDIYHQLRTIFGHLRTIELPNGEKFIGAVSRRPLLDHAFRHSCPMGPFTSVAEFHDLFAKLPWLGCDPSGPPHPFRVHLPDDVPIVFTHGDLHRANIIVSSAQEGESPRIKVLIDWGQSGWYPSYWEYCKARWTANLTGDWNTVYIPLFLDPVDCYNHWDYFLLCMGE